MGGRKSKQIYLAGGAVEGFAWCLLVGITAEQSEYAGYFDLATNARKFKGKKIYLASGSEEAYQWTLSIDIASMDIYIRLNLSIWSVVH